MKITKVTELIQAQPGDHCHICGGAPEIIGIFTPDDPGAWGAPDGKTRLFRYCLCEKCKARSDTPERIEKIIRAELAGGAIHE